MKFALLVISLIVSLLCLLVLIAIWFKISETYQKLKRFIERGKLVTSDTEPADKTKGANVFTGNPSMKWCDIICGIAIDNWINAQLEKQRLVDSGLYSYDEFKELCSFTSGCSKDYNGRLRWCCDHNVIEYRTRSTGSRWVYDSPVDYIITVYYWKNGYRCQYVRGYKDKDTLVFKDVQYCNSYDEFKDRIADPYHIMDNDPTFLGRVVNGKAILGQERGLWDGGSQIACPDFDPLF